MSKLIVTTQSGRKLIINDKNELNRGGEGRIIAIDNEPDIVAKIYHQGIAPITETRFRALIKLDKNLFVAPSELLYNLHNEIVGFIMEFIGKDFFPLSSIFTKNFCLRNAIDDNIKFIIAENLINAISYAHKNQIIIGDLNQYNILANSKGDIKLIDTDSYQTPGYTHSGFLLEDIRDYLYGGDVNQNSDYYALSVLLFYIFTYVHPFKGIHTLYKSLESRIINKIPVFKKDKDLIPPKCYEPLTDGDLHHQFHRLYSIGERFLVNLKGIDVHAIKITATIPFKIIEEDQLIITPIVENKLVQDIKFCNERGYVRTKENFIIYDARQKGILSEIYKFPTNKYSDVFITDKQILIKQGDKLLLYQNPSSIVELVNFRFPNESLIQQYENLLLVVGQDVMYTLFLDEIINQNIRVKRTEVFSLAFRLLNNMVQNTGGINRIFYNTGKDLASIKLPYRPMFVIQSANVGIIQYIDNNKVINNWFRIEGLNYSHSTQIIENISEFALLRIDNAEGFIFEPSDNKIIIRRTQDFQITSELNCTYITQHAKLQYAKSGIVAWENTNVFVINKK